MRILEIHEESQNKVMRDAKKAKLVMCELFEDLMDMFENAKYEHEDEYYEPEYRYEDEMKSGRHERMRNMRRMRGGRYSY